MKIYSKIATICLLGLLIMSFSTRSLQAQDKIKKSNAELLVGSWALDFDKSILYSNAAAIAHMNSLPEERKSRIQNSFSGRRITFHGNGVYTITSPAGKQANGKWSLSEDGKSIAVVLDNGEQMQHSILRLDSLKLVISIGKTQGGNRLFNVWELKKLN